MRNATKIYNWLLRIYPARFREEYQKPMQLQFRDEYRETSGFYDQGLLWMRVLRDLVLSAPGEVIRELAFDGKYALRVYRRRASTTLLAVVALGLAIGASTGVFSVLNALLLRSLPFADAAQLVELWQSPVTAGSGRAGFTEWSETRLYLQGAAAFSSSEMNLSGERDALRVKVAETSANFFQLLGVKPATGRTFASKEDAADQDAVAVISYGLWQQLFGGRSYLSGASIHINGAFFSVIGVAPANFDYPGKTTVWTPTVFDFEKTPKRGAFLFQTIGRLKPRVTIGVAQDMFGAEARHADPSALRGVPLDDRNRPHLTSLQDQLAGPVRQASWVLAGLALLVLLTACANISLLLLSRTTERREELELRAALGASRARLLQQLVTEATLLTMGGAVLGLLVANWISKLATSLSPPVLASQDYRVIDWRVLGFAVALALGLGLIFGVLPAFLKGRLVPSELTVRVQSGVRDIGTKRATRVLVALQIALTLCLVTSASVLGQTFLNLLNVDLGFRTASVVTLNVSLQGTRHRGPGEWRYYSEALSRLRTVHGVEAAGAVSYLPLATNVYMANAIALDSGEKVAGVVMNASMPGYFRAMGTRILAGRDFRENEKQQPEPAVIVNRAFAQSTGLALRIVGRRLKNPWGSKPYLVVGVVETERLAGPAYAGGPQVYWPIQEEPPQALTFVSSVQGRPESYLAVCRDALRSVDPQVPVYDVATLDQRLAALLSRPKLYSMATLFLAVLALLLAAAGSYGTAAHSLEQRKHEMGVRMAVGASYSRIRAMMLRESLLSILPGVTVGVALSLASGRYLENLLDGANQPTFAFCSSAAGFLILVGFVAVWTATGRVLSIAPSDALRAE